MLVCDWVSFRGTNDGLYADVKSLAFNHVTGLYGSSILGHGTLTFKRLPLRRCGMIANETAFYQRPNDVKLSN